MKMVEKGTVKAKSFSLRIRSAICVGRYPLNQNEKINLDVAFELMRGKGATVKTNANMPTDKRHKYIELKMIDGKNKATFHIYATGSIVSFGSIHLEKQQELLQRIYKDVFYDAKV